jgi:hypothetical protein
MTSAAQKKKMAENHACLKWKSAIIKEVIFKLDAADAARVTCWQDAASADGEA